MKFFIRLLIVLMILGAGACFYHFKYQKNQDQPTSTLTMYGNIDLRTVQLSFNEQEMIEQILVEEGSKVTKGQLLAKLKNNKLIAQLQEVEAMVAAQEETVLLLVAGTRPQEIKKLEAQLEAAKIRIANAKQRSNRLSLASKTGATTIQDFDDAKAQYDIAKADLVVVSESLALARDGFRKEEIASAKAILQAKKASVRILQERIKDTSLYATATGIIESRIMEPGEIAIPGRTVFSLALTNPKWVRAYLPEPDLGFISPDMEATIYSDSFSKKEFKGTVGFVSPVAEFTPKFVQTTELRTQLVYETRIWVEDPNNYLRLGMPVTVTIAKKTLTTILPR